VLHPTPRAGDIVTARGAGEHQYVMPQSETGKNAQDYPKSGRAGARIPSVW